MYKERHNFIPHSEKCEYTDTALRTHQALSAHSSVGRRMDTVGTQPLPRTLLIP